MISVLLPLYSLFALTFRFESDDPGEELSRKYAYYQSFSIDEKKSLCGESDQFACVLLFLNYLQDDTQSNEMLFSFITQHFSAKERDVSVYLLARKRIDSIDPRLLRIIMAEMSDYFSRRLYPLYLKQLFHSGKYDRFLSEFRPSCSSSLSLLKLQLLVNRGQYLQAFEFINNLPCEFGEWFYVKVDALLTPQERHMRSVALAGEFRLWRLNYYYHRVRYGVLVKMANRWFPSIRKKGELYSWRGKVWKARALTKQRKHGQALRVYRFLHQKMGDMISIPQPDIIRFFSGYGYSLAAVGKSNLSKKVYLEGFNQLNQSPEAISLLFDAADMARIDGQFEDASCFYSQLLRIAPDFPRADMVRFLQFWMLWRQNRFDAALSYIDAIIRSVDKNSYSARRAYYWRARTLDKLGKKTEAEDTYRRCYERGPATWYGALAYTRLHGSVAMPIHSTREFVDNTHELLPATLFLTALLSGKQKVKNRLVRDLTGRINERGGELDRLLAAYVTFRRGMYRVSSRMLRSVATISDATRRYHLKHYPLKYQEEIAVNAGFYDVPALFLLSLARQESFFNVTAVSSSYAIGLLQLLPSTAQVLARSEGYGKVTVENLKKPLTNTRFAAAYIRRLMNRFDNRFPLVAGAYNAGSLKIAKWIRQKKTMELDEFVEDVPIFQTRNYIKKVMRNFASYYYLYHDAPLPVMDLTLPNYKSTENVYVPPSTFYARKKR